MADKQAKSATPYVVLQKLDGHDAAWTEIGRANGHTKDDAIRAVVNQELMPDEERRESVFRAVPVRSWPAEPDLVVVSERRVETTFVKGGRRREAAPARGGSE